MTRTFMVVDGIRSARRLDDDGPVYRRMVDEIPLSHSSLHNAWHWRPDVQVDEQYWLRYGGVVLSAAPEGEAS